MNLEATAGLVWHWLNDRLPTLTLSLLFIGAGVATPQQGFAQGSVYISEFIAQNLTSTVDDFGDRSDWIELANSSGESVNLEGWSLTDDRNLPRKWVFPGVSISPNGFLQIFASGRDQRRTSAPLHTNFQLSESGEYLALFNAEGQVVAAFNPSYPSQVKDISYGVGQLRLEELRFLEIPSPARALIPMNGDLGDSWTELEFDDSSWLQGASGVGYGFSGLVELNVSAMNGLNGSVFVRIPFELEEVPAFDTLWLRMQYEDGVVVFLNGQEIMRDNAPDEVAWNSIAPSGRLNSLAVQFEEVDISSARDLLKVGQNVLAIQGLNQSVSSADLLVRPEIVARRRIANLSEVGFFLVPSPGAANPIALPGVLGSPTILPAGKSFEDSVEVSVGLPSDVPAGTIAYYTLDGTEPSRDSLLYEGPFEVTTTTQVRVKAFGPNFQESAPRSEFYLLLDPSLAEFNSNLPLVILDSPRGANIPETRWEPSYLTLFEPDAVTGRTTLRSQPTVVNRAAIKRRGSSTAGRPKPSMSLELRGEYEEDVNLGLLGMPAESDWVLWGPFDFDLTLIHNPFVYAISNEMGRYAPRTRFVEVFLGARNRALRDADYYGVYALIEKIGRDGSRVDVDRVFPDHKEKPEITGGYIFKIDRADPGDSGLRGAGETVLYVYPKEVEMEQPERASQIAYLREFFGAFQGALRTRNYLDPDRGVGLYFDVAAGIDHHVLNVLALNVDALRLSTYMHLPRNGKLTFGPVWDFDRALGSTDGRDANPRAWSGSGGTDFFNYPWWQNLFQDLEFWQLYVDRYHELRETIFSLDHLNDVIDRMVAEVAEAQVRNLNRWRNRPRFGGYEGEIQHMKDWLADRIDFIDSQLVDPVRLEGVQGSVEQGHEVVLEIPDGAGTIVYTTDGTDPRLSPTEVSPRALVYEGPIRIYGAETFVARVFHPGHVATATRSGPPRSIWSGPKTMHFFLGRSPRPGDLQLSEIYYHPSSPSISEILMGGSSDAEDYEFLEIRNQSQEVLNLAGCEWVEGIEFIFPEEEAVLLNPGEFMVWVQQRDSFEVRFGTGARIGGVLKGSGLRNSSEVLRMVNANGESLLSVNYVDTWYPSTDGGGASLQRASDQSSGNGPQFWVSRIPNPGRGFWLDGDEDGLPDDWERDQGLLVERGNTEQGGQGDLDGDGFTNEQEWRSGTHPMDGEDFLVVQSVSVIEENGVVLTFEAAAGRVYGIETRREFGDGTWIPLRTVGPILVGGSQDIQIGVGGGLGAGSHFYRVVLRD